MHPVVAVLYDWWPLSIDMGVSCASLSYSTYMVLVCDGEASEPAIPAADQVEYKSKT